MTRSQYVDRLMLAGGRAGARQPSLAVALLMLSTVVTASGPASSTATVREEHGLYRVAASFSTSQPVGVVHAVLTDYEQIPRFMPDVRTSRIVERTDTHTLVEQEAVARVLFFSKRVRLVLEVREEPSTIRFRDRSGDSFKRYEGGWTLREQDGQTFIVYELTAEPAFDVPEFLLVRLLRRDADRMIERLQGEMLARGASARLQPLPAAR
jgi:ribosome-associated toxin RatA of RatAB toxin-antitoxin module